MKAKAHKKSPKCNTPPTRMFTKPITISKHLYCVICMQVFYLPCRLNCGYKIHTFCTACIKNWLKSNNQCPQCRQLVNPVFMEVDLLAKSIIEECEVVCPKVKCPWKGMCKDLDKHGKQQCLFKEDLTLKEEYKTEDDQLKQRLHQNLPQGSLLGRVFNKSTEIYRQLHEVIPVKPQPKSTLSQFLDQLF